MKFDLAVEIREEAGKGVARRLRRNGKIPGVLYGQSECLLLALKPDDLVKILRSHAGTTSLISLTVSGAKSSAQRTALLRDYQVDPVTGSLVHADFFEVSMDKPIRVKVPVHLTGGQPVGLKEGGVLHHNMRELHIECLPSVLPDFLEVDASQLGIGQGIHLKEVPKPEGLRFLDDLDNMVVSVAAPMSEAKLEALLTSTAGVEAGKEPEVLAKGKAVAEGAVPGEAPKAGAAAPAAAEPKAAEKKEAGREPAKVEKKEAPKK